MAKSSSPNSPDSRWCQVMTTLLYPAVLGTILYSLGDAAWNSGASLLEAIKPKGLLGFALVLLFTLDYAYTLNDNPQNDYGAWQFLLDSVALVLLFAAGKIILSDTFVAGAALPATLLSVKALAVLYEISRLPKSRNSIAVARAWFSYDTDATLLLFYIGILSVWLVSGQAWPSLLALVMFIDAALYLRRVK